ncbi:hypothetical protein E2C01_012812 [Portunus trituberculatus]|uniref:Uncharacterized protein n=1 Tax=Portunus trituberculatus TaxID=210409 RepID=A0A5B7DEN7_PORTR|nr:hypothetical protein [Portunus trituberculatus]
MPGCVCCEYVHFLCRVAPVLLTTFVMHRLSRPEPLFRFLGDRVPNRRGHQHDHRRRRCRGLRVVAGAGVGFNR